MAEARKLALMWYVADIQKTFGNCPKVAIEVAAQEISRLSSVIPIYDAQQSYASGEMLGALESLGEVRNLRGYKDNSFDILINNQVVKKGVSPIYLMAFMAWSLRFMTGQELPDKDFDYVEEGLKLAEIL